MKLPTLSYRVPHRVEEATALPAESPIDADALAGGQSLMPLPHVGLRETRSTLVGSLTRDDRAAELRAVAVALDAKVVLRSVDGERVVVADEFFTGA